MLDRRIMGELGPSFSTRRLDYLLLFLIRASIFFTLVAVRLPLLLAFTSTSFFFFGPFLRPVGHRVHLGSDLEDNKQDKSQSTELQQSGMKKTKSQSEKCGQTLSGS